MQAKPQLWLELTWKWLSTTPTPPPKLSTHHHPPTETPCHQYPGCHLLDFDQYLKVRFLGTVTANKNPGDGCLGKIFPSDDSPGDIWPKLYARKPLVAQFHEMNVH